MLTEESKEEIRTLYRDCIETLSLKKRRGQGVMIAKIANAIGEVTAGEHGERTNEAGIAVIEAGTGTGKTLAYLVSTLPLALKLGKKLVVSTATVTLQEQIINKDLPSLQEASNLDFQYTLAKGRGRYLCLSKLEKSLIRLKDTKPVTTDMFGLTDKEKEKILYTELLNKYGSNEWDGDKDALGLEIIDSQWQNLTSTHHDCSKRRCPHYDNCAFYKARNYLDEADIVVANHDLVLADLSLGGGVILPAPEDAIYIFDEGHHLADKALGHFHLEASIPAQKAWLEQLEKNLQEFINDRDTPKEFQRNLAKLPEMISGLLETLTQTHPYIIDLLGQQEKLRFAQGAVPSELRLLLSNMKEPMQQVVHSLGALNEALQKSLDPRADGLFVKEAAEQWQAAIGALLQKAEQLLNTLTYFCAEQDKEGIPVARWINKTTFANKTETHINACPISISNQLYNTLWKRCYSAVVTSATLTALNKFDKLIWETGIPTWAVFERVESPFNYQELGELDVVTLKSNPNEPGFQGDVEEWLDTKVDLKQATLVLFSSRVQLEATRERFIGDWADSLFCQGYLPRPEIVRLHKERVDDGQGSIIFGLASFAEGVDLPGNYVNHVVIVKIPFAVPDDPMQEAIAEWLQAQGGNPFWGLTLPAASIRLIQACGRLIRTETDTGRVSILDKRLQTKSYGRELIASLPPFKRI